MKRLTRQQAINAKCKDCIYDPRCGGGTWREQVAQCSATDCALWPYRPGPEGGKWQNAPRDPENVPDGWPSFPVGGMYEPSVDLSAEGSTRRSPET